MTKSDRRVEPTDAPETSPIPFHRVELSDRELERVRESFESGDVDAFGSFTDDVTRLLGEWHDGAEVVLTTSCTDALEMAALLLDIKPGDRVIVPSFTFVSTAIAFVRAGAEIVFADIEEETLGIDPASVERLMDSSVRAVVPVHYSGIGCRIDDLQKVVPPGVAIVEDNAHGLYGSIAGRPLGTFGRFSALSFHATKNFISGEGGALVMNDPEDADRAHVVAQKGTDRRRFLEGLVDKYTWRDVGSSFGMSDILAAILLEQLRQRPEIQRRRREVFDRYVAAFEPWAADTGIRMPVIPPGYDSAYHLFYVLMPDRRLRDRAIEGLRALGIGSAFHFQPLHDSPGGKRYGAEGPDCPISSDVAGRVLRLPFYPSLTDAEVDRVVSGLAGAITS